MSEKSRYLTILNRKEGFLLHHNLAKRTKYGLKVQKNCLQSEKDVTQIGPGWKHAHKAQVL